MLCDALQAVRATQSSGERGGQRAGATQDSFLPREQLELDLEGWLLLFGLTNFYRSATCQALHLALGCYLEREEMDTQTWGA